MTGDDLPPDLAALEQALGGGPLPSMAVRARTMATVEEELHVSRRREFWQFVSGVAASVLLLINFSVSIASVQRQVPRMEAASAKSLYEEIDKLQLALSDDEIRRQSLLLAAGKDLLPFAAPCGSMPGTSVIPNQ